VAAHAAAPAPVPFFSASKHAISTLLLLHAYEELVPCTALEESVSSFSEALCHKAKGSSCGKG